jgi:hypothetical protein
MNSFDARSPHPSDRRPPFSSPGTTERQARSARPATYRTAHPSSTPPSSPASSKRPSRTGPLWDEVPESLRERPTPRTPSVGTVPPQLAARLVAAPPRHYWRTTGLGLKLRFLAALCVLALFPAIGLVLVSQSSSQALADESASQVLHSAGRADATALNEQLASLRHVVEQLAKDPLLLGFENTNTDPATISRAEALLHGTSEAASPGGLIWAVLSGGDQVLASWPASNPGQALARLSVLHDAAGLETYVQAQRHAAGPSSPIGVGRDAAVPGKMWLASMAFLTPTDQGKSLVVLALCSLAEFAQPLLSPMGASSYVLLVDRSGTLLGVQGNQRLAEQVGQPLAIVPLRQAAASTAPEGSLATFVDPTSGAALEGAGVACGPPAFGWVCLVVAPSAQVHPEPGGLLEPRNTPLIFLSLIVVIVLVGAAVSFPIVQPIRRATRQILTTAEGIRVLTKNIEGMGEDHVMMGQVVDLMARGFLTRSVALASHASAMRQWLVTAAHPLVRMAHQVTATRHQDPRAAEWFQSQITQTYQALEQADHFAVGMIQGVQQLFPQTQLGEIREGVQDMSETALASKEGLLRATEDLQSLRKIAEDLAQGRGSRENPHRT